MTSKWTARLAGAAAGLVNGLFGGGGGMVLLPILRRSSGLSPRRLYATSVAVIFPVCLVSAGAYVWQGGVTLSAALPYLAGGLCGGLLGGHLYARVPTALLQRLFAALLLYAGVRYLL